MKEIGIVICNYNKEDYIVNCIQSVLNSSIDNFDVFIVDNASTDGSVDAIQKNFGNQLHLLVNKENIGGAGGFDTGLREVLKYDYKYLMLMDNDIIVDSKAIEELFLFMEEEKNQDVGMVGSKVYFMDSPDKIWGYGGHIDFDQYIQVDEYKNMVDCDEIPLISYCDYVAACSLMVRTQAVKKVGIMPEENFIYWDDIEWGYRFKQAGYKVAVCGKSKIWHKAGGRNAGNTFINYYMWRNRIKFFIKTVPAESRNHLVNSILAELFRTIYSCNLKKEINVIKTVFFAFDDAVHGVTGKASEGRILPRPEVENRLENAIKGANNILIKYNNDMEALGNIIKGIEKINKESKVTISVADYRNAENIIRKQYKNCAITNEYEPQDYDQYFTMCEHVFKLTEDSKHSNYIDSWCNVIFSEEDFIYASNCKNSEALFVTCNSGIMLNVKEWK